MSQAYKRDEHSDYKREYRTRRNVYESPPPPTPEHTDYKREYRTRQNVYEPPPPPPPLELSCSVCQTAEHDGTNLWSSLPYISYSAFFGPTLGDILIIILNMLPVSIVSWLGIGHEKSCKVKAQHDNSSPLAREQNETGIRRSCTTRNEGFLEGGADRPSERRDSPPDWMKKEYLSLVRELAEITKLTTEGDAISNQDLQKARNYVLDCLAEMLTKREELEKRSKKNNGKEHRTEEKNELYC